jgi:peroxin-1
VLVDRAAHAAAARFLSPDATNASITEWLLKQSLSARREKFELNMLDFKTAQHNFVPSAMQGIAKGGTEVGRSGWDDVGGLLETRRSLQEVSKLLSHAMCLPRS